MIIQHSDSDIYPFLITSISILMALQSRSSSTSAHPFSSSSTRYEWKYDVFISFRGKDTRYGFTGSLYKTLRDKGIRTYFDDYDLESGEEITPALLKAIENSRIAIIVLSANYAESRFCVVELVHILDHIKANNRFVVPVFFKVDPCDVRRLENSFGKGMAKLQKRNKNDKNKVDRWKKGLKDVADLSGHHLKENGNEYEYLFIDKIVKDIKRKISRVPLPMPDHPVGLESRVSKVISLLEMDSSDRVHMVGIHGIGGMGKTTLARAIYNLIADNFEGVCFLEDVRENSQRYGLMHLQNNLLCKILGKEEVQIIGVCDGISQIQRRLSQMKVLLVLDDVDDSKQLQDLAGKLDWFGGGSRVIITTQDTHLLKLHGVENKYEVKELNRDESIELLVWHASKKDIASPGNLTKDLLDRAVNYASGHPLALEVIGSNLSVIDLKEWKSTFDQHEYVLDKKILKVLELSFKALTEEEQLVFLDITCCLKGHNLMEIKDILRVHYPGYKSLEHCIKQLVNKSLIKIEFGDQVRFHNLIEHMGKETVRQESPFMPGDRSRLWSHEDIVRVLKGDQGSETTKMIYLEFPLQKTDENEDSMEKEKNKAVKVEWNGMAFEKMKNLRTLIIKNGSFSQGPKHLPNSLRVLEWWGYPSDQLPTGFNPNLLSILRLPCYLFESFNFKVDNLSKKFATLNVLNFDNSNFLKEIPDVTGLVALERLTFSGCKNLITVDSSVGLLNNLKILKADGCKSLRSFPSINLPSLELLMLSDCSSLEKFPEIIGKMEKVAMLHLRGTKIKDLPGSFQNLCGLSTLTLCGKNFRRIPSVIVKMPKLSTFHVEQTPISDSWVSPNKLEEGDEGILSSSNVSKLVLTTYMLSDDFFPLALAWFPNVKTLDLSGNNFTILPECIQQFHLLSSLKVDKCDKLKKIEGIPPNLKQFSAVGCRSLTPSATSLLLNQELHENGNTEFSLPGEAGTKIPSWFEQRGEGGSISFWFRGMFPAKDLCLAILVTDFSHLQQNGFVSYGKTMVKINGNQVSRGRERTKRQELYIFDLSATNKKYDLDGICVENQWNHAEISYDVVGKVEIGMHILKQESSSITEDIRFTDPSRERKREDGDINSIAQVIEGEGQQLCASNCASPRNPDPRQRHISTLLYCSLLTVIWFVVSRR